MDTTVPVGAARLLDFIRDTEVGTDDRGGYDVIYGFNRTKLPKPVTSMTVGEVLAAQAGWSKRFRARVLLFTRRLSSGSGLRRRRRT